MEFSKLLIAFDLDGTLNQTHLYALKAYHKTFEELEVGSFTDKQILSRFGAPFEEDLHYFFKQPSADLIIKFQEILAKNWNHYLSQAKPYPDTVETLSYLKRKGAVLAICSNAPLDEIIKTLKVLKIDKYFDKIQGLESHKTKKDSLNLLINKCRCEKTIMVGDRYYDYEAANHNQALFIGCNYGYGKDELQDIEHCINNISEVINVIEVI